MRASTKDQGPLRVTVLCDVPEKRHGQFLAAYDLIRHHVAAVPGHIVDQLCRSTENPAEWLITSEWQSESSFLEWAASTDHLDLVKPLRSCVSSMRASRYTIARVTRQPRDVSAAATERPITRHAISYVVRPGHGDPVTDVFRSSPPPPRAAAHARLRRSCLYRYGDRFIRMVEIDGGSEHAVPTLLEILRQPQVRAIEAKVRPHMVDGVDMQDTDAGRAFLNRAALPTVHHHETISHQETDHHDETVTHYESVTQRESDHHPERRTHGVVDAPRRIGVYYPVRAGRGRALAALLAAHDQAAVAEPGTPLLAATVYASDDLVVRTADFSCPAPDLPGLALGLTDGAVAAVLDSLLEPSAVAAHNLTTPQGQRGFLGAHQLTVVVEGAVLRR